MNEPVTTTTIWRSIQNEDGTSTHTKTVITTGPGYTEGFDDGWNAREASQ